MTVSAGFSAEEIREFVHQYHSQPHGQRLVWLAEQGVSKSRLYRWRLALFEGDLERGLIPRHGSAMTISPSQRLALEKQRARERAEQQEQIARLQARVKELEDTNDALGKAIGLLHQLSEQEPDALPTQTDPSGS